MTVEHKDLGEADLHALKGFSSAGNNTGPSKNNSGALVWSGSVNKYITVYTIDNTGSVPASVRFFTMPEAGTIISVLYVNQNAFVLGSTTHGIQVNGVIDTSANFTGALSANGGTGKVTGLSISLVADDVIQYSIIIASKTSCTFVIAPA